MNRPSGLIIDKPNGLTLQASDRMNAIRGIISPSAQISNADGFSTLPINKLIEFPDHPFSVRDDEEMDALAESIKRQGIIYPVIVRPNPQNTETYEILAGHRRVFAAKKIGLYEVPVKILNVDDDTAILIMTDTNLKQRDKILHSEKAKSYRLQLDSLKRLEGKKFDAAGKIAEENGEGRRNIFFYIKLNDLVPDLLEMTDNGDLYFRAAVALADLAQVEQEAVTDLLNSGRVKKISIEQAERIRENRGGLTQQSIVDLIKPKKVDSGNQDWKPIYSATQRVSKYFKKNLQSMPIVALDENELEEILIRAVQAYVVSRSGNGEDDDDL